jgi:aromatic-L-amino-acid decarboxylase
MNEGSGFDEARTDSLAWAVGALVPLLEEAFTSQTVSPAAYVADPVSSVPEVGIGLEGVVSDLSAYVRDAVSLTAPGFCSYILQGPTTAAVAARAAAAVGGVRYFLHSMHHLEELGLRWLGDTCGIPPSAGGVFVSGGSVANLVGLGAARQHAWESRGIDVAEAGLQGGPAARIYASELAHRTIHRSAAVLGLGRSGVVPIPVDQRGRMVVSTLESQMTDDRNKGHVPVAVVAVAGTTDVGSVDPISDIVDVARRHDCWVHVDGAYGLPAYASERARALFDGVADADSWIVDPHKWLATGAGIAAAFVRDRDLLTRAFDQGHAAYLDDAYHDEPNAVSVFDSIAGPWADQSIELTAPPRGAVVWAVLREIGRRGVAQRVDRHLALATLLAEEVKGDERLELALEPDLSIVCFRHLAPPEVDENLLNHRIVTELRQHTNTVPSTTVWNDRVVIRPCFINPRQSEADVYALLDNVRAIGRRLLATSP